MRIFGSVGIGPFRFGASGRPFRRCPARRYVHAGCPVQHRSAAAADRCPNGRNTRHAR